MAKYTPGTLGPLQGKIGNVIASRWRDIHYLRARPEKSNKPPTEKKKNSQNGFGFVSTWLVHLHQLVMIGFRDYDPRWTGRTTAQSYICHHALVKTAEGFDINYGAVRFSHGDLPGAEHASIAMKDANTLILKWSNELREGADPSDALMYLIARPKSGHIFIVGIFEKARRDQELEVTLAPAFRTGKVHVLIAFRSLIAEKNSISQYVGAIDFDAPGETLTEPDASTLTAFCQTAGFTGALIKRVGVD